MKVKVYHTNHEQEAVDMEFETLQDVFIYARKYIEDKAKLHNRPVYEEYEVQELVLTTVDIWDKDEDGNYIVDEKGFYVGTKYPALEIYDDWRE